MIRHNLTVAIRNLMKYKIQTLISVVSIAVGIVTLSFTHAALENYRLPTIYNEPYHDRAYEVGFTSISDGNSIPVNQEIIRALKSGEGLITAEKIAVPNGFFQYINVEFHLPDSSTLKGKVKGERIDPGYADFAGFRSSITGKKIGILKEGEAIVGEKYAKEIFGDKNPVGAIQVATNRTQPMPVTIVDVYEPLSVFDGPFSDNGFYYCIADDLADYSDNDYFAMYIGLVLKDGFTESELENEIGNRLKPLDLKPKLTRITEKPDFKTSVTIRVICYLIGTLILLAAIIGFLRIELQLFRIRHRELAIRIVNGASKRGLFGMLFTEIVISISLAVAISLILGVLLQDFVDANLGFFITFSGFRIHDLWLFSLMIGVGLLMVCGLISWFVLCRIYRRAGGVGENMRRSRNHLLRNVMLFLQTLICMTFVCCTFILVNGSHRIFEACNIPDNNDLYKEYLYYDPEFCVDKKRVLSEIISLPELDKAILCGGAYMPPKEIRDNPEIKEKLAGRIYFMTYLTDDAALLSALDMKVDWFNVSVDRNNCLLVSETLYQRLRDLGVLDNNMLTMDFMDGEITLPIAGVIRSIAYDTKGESFVAIRSHWGDDDQNYLLIPKPGKGKSLARSIDETVEKIEPGLIKSTVSSYRQRISPGADLIEAARTGGWILGSVSLLICVMGIYSSIALDTRARKKEIAIRKVNGAKSRDIYRMFGRLYLVIIILSLFITVPVCLLFNKMVEDFAKELSISFSPVLPIALGCFLVISLIIGIVGVQIHRVMQADPSTTIAKE